MVLYSALGSEGVNEHVDRERLASRMGFLLRDLLRQSGVKRAVVAGGDTASHAGRELGVHALTLAAPVEPGAPLCQAHSDDRALQGLELIFKVEKTDLHITAAERLSAGEFTLQVGEVTESVTVDASGTPVQVNSAERSGVLTSAQIGTLMARGRDFMSLLRVMPGVVPSSDSDAIGTRAAYPNAQGMRISYPSVAIDGVTNNDLGSSQTTPTF